MIHLFRRAISMLVLALFFKSPAHSQDSSMSTSAINLDLSTGFGEVENLAYTFTTEVRLREQHQLITLQILYSKELEISFVDRLFPGGGIRSASPQGEIFNVGLLYGLTSSFHLKRMLFPFFPFAILINHEADYSISGSVGVSAFNSILRGAAVQQGSGGGASTTYAEDRRISAGVPVQVELVQYFTPFVGYVHRLYYNFNSRQEFWSLLWGVQVRI